MSNMKKIYVGNEQNKAVDLTKDLATETGVENLVKDTVGWTGKNLLPITGKTETIGDITFTVGPDKSVVVNGSNSSQTNFFLNNYVDMHLKAGKYKITGIPAGGNKNSTFWLYLRNEANTSTMDIITNGEINIAIEDNYRLLIAIYANYVATNLTFNLMITNSDINDSTYEPYHESVEEYVFPASAQGVLGAKNLLKATTDTQTINGVTFTVNRDSDGNVLSVTANGTATENAGLCLDPTSGDQLFLNQYGYQKYILSGCPAGGSEDSYFAYIHPGYINNAWKPSLKDYGNGCEFDYDGQTKVYVAVFVKKGATANNLVFKPMIRLASDPDDTYAPYAKTNKELTDDLTDKGVSFRFGIDSNGNYGYIKAGADTVTPFKTGSEEVKGNAVAANVLANDGTNNITFSSAAAGSNIAGTMTNRGAVSQTLNPGGSYTVPQGYHNGSGTVSARSLVLQEKTATLRGVDGSTISDNITPDSGKDGLSKVVVPRVSGNAVAANVLANDGTKNITFSSAGSPTGASGTMTNNGAVSQTLNPGGSYTVPAGYHNGSGKVTARSLVLQEKSITPSTTAQTATPDSGKDGLSKVTVSAIQTQTKSVTPSTAAQTVTPDSGKYLSSVSVGAISTQTKTATLTGSQYSVTPDSGKYLTSVTIPAVVGTAGTGDVLATKTFSSAANPTGTTGTMTNQGSFSFTPTLTQANITSNGTYTVTSSTSSGGAGYYSGVAINQGSKSFTVNVQPSTFSKGRAEAKNQENTFTISHGLKREPLFVLIFLTDTSSNYTIDSTFLKHAYVMIYNNLLSDNGKRYLITSCFDYPYSDLNCCKRDTVGGTHYSTTLPYIKSITSTTIEFVAPSGIYFPNDDAISYDYMIYTAYYI